MKHSGSRYKNRCDYCHKAFESSAQVSRHVAHSYSCRHQWEKDLQKLPAHHPLPQEANELDIDHDDYVLQAPHATDHNIEVHVEGLVEGRVETRGIDENADETVGSAYRHTRWTEAYPGQVAQGYGRRKTTFAAWRDKQMLTGASPWSPFEDEEEWELTQWLFKNVGQSAIDEYLKLPLVSFRHLMKSCRLHIEN